MLACPYAGSAAKDRRPPCRRRARPRAQRLWGRPVRPEAVGISGSQFLHRDFRRRTRATGPSRNFPRTSACAHGVRAV